MFSNHLVIQIKQGKITLFELVTRRATGKNGSKENQVSESVFKMQLDLIPMRHILPHGH